MDCFSLKIGLLLVFHTVCFKAIQAGTVPQLWDII